MSQEGSARLRSVHRHAELVSDTRSRGLKGCYACREGGQALYGISTSVPVRGRNQIMRSSTHAGVVDRDQVPCHQAADLALSGKTSGDLWPIRQTISLPLVIYSKIASARIRVRRS
jgi:hypothetical protein